MFCRSGVSSPGIGGAIEAKLPNGGAEGVISTAHGDSLILVGGPELVKREPEDLTRKSISPTERLVLNDPKRRQFILAVPSHGEPPSLDQGLVKEDLDAHIKDEEEDNPRTNHTLVIQAPLDSADKMSASGYLGSFSAASPQPNYDHMPSYLAPSPQPYATSSSPVIRGSPAVYTTTDPACYREYYQVSEPLYTTVRPEYMATDAVFERYSRPTPAAYKTVNLTVDSSPDSGISDTLPARDQNLLPQVGALTPASGLSVLYHAIFLV